MFEPQLPLRIWWYEVFLHLSVFSVLAPLGLLLGWALLLLIGVRRRNRWIILLASWFLVLCVLSLAIWGVQARVALKPASIKPDTGYAFVAKIKQRHGPFFVPSDDAESVRRSGLRLYEDGIRLRPDHAPHEAIRKKGKGALSHWGGQLYFSTRDGTDPTTNGRHYSIRLKLFLSPVIAIAISLMAFATSWIFVRRLGQSSTSLISLVGGWLRAGYLEHKSRTRPQINCCRIFGYLAVWFLLALAGTLIASAWTYPEYPAQRSGSAPLIPRVKYYLANRDRYDMISFGDSQSHYAIHPLLMNKIAGIRGYNLTYPSTFVPLQYAAVTDLAPQIPKSTTVILNVTFQNFEKGNDRRIYPWYPIDFFDAFRMWRWGLRAEGLWNNVLFFSRLTHFIAARSELRSTLVSLIGRPLVPVINKAEGSRDLNTELVRASQNLGDADGIVKSGGLNEDASNPTSISSIPKPPVMPSDSDRDVALRAFYSKAPGIDAVETIQDEGVLTSVLLSFIDGSSCRMEVTPDFFRQMQLQQSPWTDAQEQTYPLPEIDTAKVKMFAGMLDALRAQGLHVIVNIIEEAPIFYRHPNRTKRIRALLQQTIRPLAQSRGYDFVRIDWDAFANSDYFDLTHLNCNGAQKAAALIANEFRALIKRNGG